MNQSDEVQTPWERKVIEKLLLSNIREQRSARRWRIFFRLVFLILFAALLVFLFSKDKFDVGRVATGEHTALIKINDVIGVEDLGVTADDVLTGLKKAYENTNTQGIVLRINSPGGSAVQSALIYDGIRRLRAKHSNIPVYAVIEDVGASGAYFIASAADEIYANKSSIVGSIGVLVNGFGFVGTMNKLGIERRLLTAGEHKGILDPFSPLSETDRIYTQEVLDELHEQFIDAVKKGRGDRLVISDEIFSGLFWSGVTAKQYGLIDGFGDTDKVARELIGAEEVVDYTIEESTLSLLFGGLGQGVAQGFAKSFYAATLKGW